MRRNERHKTQDWKTKLRLSLFGLAIDYKGNEWFDRQDCKPYRSSSPYRNHFICTDCRKGFKGVWDTNCPSCSRPCEEVYEDICPDCGSDISWMRHKNCPDCRKEMIPVSKDFPVPSKNNVRAWKYVEQLMAEREKYNPFKYQL